MPSDPLKDLSKKPTPTTEELQKENTRLKEYLASLPVLEKTKDHGKLEPDRLEKIWDQAILAGFISVSQFKGLNLNDPGYMCLVMKVFEAADVAVRGAKMYFEEKDREAKIVEVAKRKILPE